MRNKPLTFSALIILAITVSLLAQQKPAKEGGNHLGTWQLVSTKYGDAKDFSDYPTERQRLKMITATHFNWVDYDTKTKKVSSSAGSRYKLRGDVYTETIEFVGDGMETYLDKAQEFTIRTDGDRLFQSGKLSDGLTIEEVWKRVN